MDDLLPTLVTLQADHAWDGLVWDGAPAHHAKRPAESNLARVFLPAYSPEPGSVERVFQDQRSGRFSPPGLRSDPELSD